MKKTLLASLLLLALNAQAESVLRRANGSEPKSIDPQLANESAGSAVIYDTFEGLVAFAINGDIVPGVAEKWDISADGTVYTFHLRDTAKWSNGDPVTAQDFVYAWQRAVNPATGGNYAFILYPVKNAEKIANGEEKDLNALGIKALDERTVEITLENPTPYFLEMAAFYTAMPVPQKVVQAHGDQWTRPENFVSNGPYHITEWLPQAHISAKKSDTYWDAGQVNIDKVVYYATEDTNSALKRYRAGELDFLDTLPPDQIEWARTNLPDELHIDPYLGIYYYGFNLDKEPFKDNPKLRKALTLAVDRNILIDKITKAGQIPAYNLVPAATKNSKPYLPDYAGLSQKERNEAAKKLYEEAGYGKDKPLKLTLTYNTNEAHKQIAVAIAAMWKQTLGVETTPENMEWKVMLDSIKNGNAMMWRYGWIGDYNDPYTFLEPLQSSSELNYVRYKNPEFDAKLKEASATLDLDKRAELLREAEQMVIDHHAMVPIYHYVSVYMLKPHIKGYAPNVRKVLPSKYLSIDN